MKPAGMIKVLLSMTLKPKRAEAIAQQSIASGVNPIKYTTAIQRTVLPASIRGY
ncbi:MAG: hypothetical protein Q4B48_05325 [Syntrophomonadaceae bacterium]|nr:hypothetical protein [Syntrophomonadaceae bacterium]